MEKFQQMLAYAGKYQISIQFWGEGNTNVYIEKDSVPLTDFGGLDPEEAISKTVEYLDRINSKKKTKTKDNTGNIKQVNTGKAELLLVKVPEYDLAMVFENELFLNKLNQEAHFRLILTEGNWIPLGLSTELTEEQYEGLVNSGGGWYGTFENYTVHRMWSKTSFSAKQSFATFMQVNECTDEPYLVLVKNKL